MNTVKFTGDTTTNVDANSANTKYIVEAGVDITPVSGYAIDATSKADHRDFQIDGHLAGTAGIQAGNDYHHASNTNIVIGKTGEIDGSFWGVLAKGDDTTVTNHGKIDSGMNGVESMGVGVAVNKTGVITSAGVGVVIGGEDLVMKNSGLISGGGGVEALANPGAHVLIENSGLITGTYFAIELSNSIDTVYNTGTLKGDVFLFANNDTYDNKGGVTEGLVDGGIGADTLRGGSQTDLLSGNVGNDILLGRGGSDEFVFSTGFDHDVVKDFDAKGQGHDLVDLSAMSGFTSFADLAGHMSEQNGDAVLNFGHGDVLTLKDVDFHDLSANDFVF